MDFAKFKEIINQKGRDFPAFHFLSEVFGLRVKAQEYSGSLVFRHQAISTHDSRCI